MVDIETFKIRLAETMDWCRRRIVADDPQNSLRSPSLRPPGLRISNLLGLGFQQVVNTVARERAKHITAWNRKSTKPSTDLSGGRLLLCTSVTESIPDGNVTAMSKGFYDEDDLPPWDTWICYVVGERLEYLISWAPPEWIDLAGIGVERHFLDCMRWVEITDIEIVLLIQ